MWSKTSFYWAWKWKTSLEEHLQLAFSVVDSPARLTMDFGEMSTPALGAPPSPSSSLVLVSAELLLSHILTASFWLQLCRSFSPSYIPRGAATVTDGLSLGQQQAPPGAVWHWLCRTWGEASSYTWRPPLLKWPWKPNSELLITSSMSSSLNKVKI